MANALFGKIEDISGGTVTLTGGITARFDPGDTRSAALLSALEDLRHLGHPVHLELEAGAVTRVRIPKIVRVERIAEEGGEAVVALHPSHARHTVRNDALLRMLRQAGRDEWLAVTVTDSGEIIDVRPWHRPFDAEPPPKRWWNWPGWPWNWNWSGCITRANAQQLFELVAAAPEDAESPRVHHCLYPGAELQTPTRATTSSSIILSTTATRARNRTSRCSGSRSKSAPPPTARRPTRTVRNACI